jgi:hypothetical protein
VECGRREQFAGGPRLRWNAADRGVPPAIPRLPRRACDVLRMPPLIAALAVLDFAGASVEWTKAGVRDDRTQGQQTGDGGGAEGNRTPDLLIANEALSQLSYSPIAGLGPSWDGVYARRP